MASTPTDQLLKLEGNSHCCDCNTPNPTWASTNIGCLICIQCSGIHRQLGTHISKVKSISLDKWTNELINQFLEKGGNLKINKYYESVPLASFPKPNINTNREYREEYIKLKYETLLFTKSDCKLSEDEKNKLKPKNKITATLDNNNDESQMSTTLTHSSNSMYDMLRRKDSLNNSSLNSGMIEYIGLLKIKIIKGTNLISCDVNGKSDPYCIVGIGNDLNDRSKTYPGQVMKTKVVEKTLDPIWNETVTCSVADLENDILHIECVDWDLMTSDDKMGHYSIYLKELFNNGDYKKVVNKTVKLQSVKKGEIEFEVEFISLK
ncbi:hypothetical protein ABK040_007506 [Willaertia magna]